MFKYGFSSAVWSHLMARGNAQQAMRLGGKRLPVLFTKTMERTGWLWMPRQTPAKTRINMMACERMVRATESTRQRLANRRCHKMHKRLGLV